MTHTTLSPALAGIPACLSAADPQAPSERRRWLLAVSAGAGAGMVATALPFAASFTPSERAKAMGSSVEVDISDLAPGGIKTVEWRGKPVWIMRRTPEMVKALEGSVQPLADPQSQRDQQPDYAKNAHRSIKADLFVGVGVCTHLGCSPNPVPQASANPSVGADWQGGFFCPCHGSTFDWAGRVYQNKPAPSNLEVPPHRYLADNTLLIGEDDNTKA